jgi:hypothetical protein
MKRFGITLPKDKKTTVISLLILLLISLGYTVVLLLNFVLHSKIWIDGYYPVYFGQFDGHYPLFSSWWSNLGIGEYPFFFNILLYVPLKLLIFVSGEYLGWVFYMTFLFLVGIMTFSNYLRKLFKNIPVVYSLLLGAVYVSYLGFNEEIIYYSLKICVVFMPLSIYFLLLSYSSIKNKANFRNLILPLIGFSFLLLNYVIFDPRSVIALVVLIGIHLVYLFIRDRDKRSILWTFSWAILGIVGGVILYYPIKYPQAISYLYSGQLAAATPSSVVTSSGLMAMLLHSNPSINPSPLILLGIFLFVISVFASLISLKNKYKNFYFFLILLFISYFIFTDRKILTILTVYLPYGQLFRTWEIGQYIINFFLPLAFVGIFIQKKNKF